MTHQFNGLVSNPPWLALSKLANNPYRDTLRSKAEQFGIRPAGPAFLHVEMATIFLLHAIDRYLDGKAMIGCIVPETVLNGYHHHPFRAAAYWGGAHPVPFALTEIWRVQQDTFKNKAIVLFGTKAPPVSGRPDPIPGTLVAEDDTVPLQFHRHTRGRRTAWSEQPAGASGVGFFSPATFRQGADIIPRTLFIHKLSPTAALHGRRQWQVRPIDWATSPLAFAVKDPKKHKGFRITPQVVPDDLVFDVLTSNLMTQFDLTAPLKALLPIHKDASGAWAQLTDAAVAAKGAGADAAIRQIGQLIGVGSSAGSIWGLIDTRSKLSRQRLIAEKYLVFTGSGGSNVCSAYAQMDASIVSKLIIDQTLYWALVDDEETAIYLTGLFNSEAINPIIREFQPSGLFRERHVHTLPHEVTPPYDPSLAAHQDVVAATRALLTDYEMAKASDSSLR